MEAKIEYLAWPCSMLRVVWRQVADRGCGTGRKRYKSVCYKISNQVSKNSEIFSFPFLCKFTFSACSRKNVCMFLANGAKGLPNGKEKLRKGSAELMYPSYRIRTQVYWNVEAYVE